MQHDVDVARRENLPSLQRDMQMKGAVVAFLVVWVAWYREMSWGGPDVALLLTATVAGAAALALCLDAGSTASWRPTAQVLVSLLAVAITHLGLGYAAAAPFYVVPVLMAGFYVAPWAPVAVAAAATGLYLAAPGEDPLTLLMLLWLVAGLAACLTHDMRSALWQAWGDAQRAGILTREVRLRQAEVNRLNKALHVSNGLLKRSLRELAAAQKEAAEARRLKEQFATTVSHELRTPLNIILGFLEVMQRYPEVYGDVHWTPSLRLDVDEMQSSAQYLSELVDDILDLARVEALKMPVRREPTSLRTLVDEAVQLARRLLMEKPGVALRLDVPDELPPLMVDRTRIRQVLLNLLANACRFTSEGEIAIGASLDGDEVVVTVADTGPGIPEEQLESVFEEFLQSETAGFEEQHRAGKGLGLAIAKRFVKLHGGRIWAENRHDDGRTGTIFTFALPLVAKQLARLGEPPQLEVAASAEAPAVVLVGDEEACAFASRHIEGYRFLRAEDMAAARRLVRERHPEAVLVNAAPEPEDATIGTAPELLPEPVPVLHCSLPVGHWQATGYFSDWLVKPVDSQRLLQALKHFVGARKLLLVDDDRAFVRMMRRMLAAAGEPYEVVWAYDGDEALAKLREGGIDGVMLDIALPGAGGYSVARAIRESVSETMPIVAVTAAEPANRDDGRLARSFSVTDYRGLSEGDTLALVQACLGRLRPGYAISEPAADSPGNQPEIPAS